MGRTLHLWHPPQPKTNVDCTHSNFGMAIMLLPPWSTRHYLQACHESFQDASSKHWWWFNCERDWYFAWGRVGWCNSQTNNLECGLGDNDTTNKQPKQKKILELIKRHESNTYGDIIDIIDKVSSNLKATTMEFPLLQLHLLSTLKVLKGKQHNILVWGVPKLAHLDTTTLFPYATSDNGLKSQRRLLESPTQKHNHLKDKTTRHRHT